MANPNHINAQAFTVPANADLSTKQYYAVTVNSSGNAAVAGAASPLPYILGNKPTSGQAAEVMYSGVVPVIAGGTVAAGASVKTDSNGKAVTASAGNAAIGVAISGGASGELINVNLFAHTAA